MELYNNINKKIYRTNFNLLGCSNYAFPLVLIKRNFKNRNLLERVMLKNKIEFRRGNAGGGNQLRQPYLKKLKKKNKSYKEFSNTEYIHHFGYYIGNYPNLPLSEIDWLCQLLAKI